MKILFGFNVWESMNKEQQLIAINYLLEKCNYEYNFNFKIDYDYVGLEVI